MIFIHVSIVIFIIILILTILLGILYEDDLIERMIRGSFFIVGSLIYMVSDFFRITIPEIIIHTFTNAGFFIKYITPLAVGIIAEKILVEIFNRDTDLATRLLILTSPFIIFSYINLYYLVVSGSKNVNVDLLLPNIFFSIGVIISFGITYKR